MKRVVAAGLVLCLLLLWGRFSRGVAGSRVYLSSWAVRVPAGAQVAQRLARRHGMLYLGQVIEGEHYYHLKHRGIVQRSLTRHWGWHIRLKREPLVPWFEQQTAKRRAKRAVTVVPTDPWFYKQWYINSDVFPDLNVLSAWSQGYTGSGVVVTILDDGIEKDHPDLVANYDPEASYDFNDNDPDPQPRYNAWDENRHGTRCAGEVAATADNDVCGAGIAYRAKIGGVRMLDGTVTDIVEAQSLSFHPQHIDIYSASWGPEDDGKTVDGPGILATEAFHKGIINGRQGLGSLFVWASGNGGLRSDNCNCDGYTNSIYTLSVGSTTERGRVPWYNEACASTLTTTYSSGAKGEKQIVTTDLRHTCTSGHTGTSASAPLAAGMISLALEANPALTWRDMQHIVVRASRPAHLQADDWAVNGVGRKVSHYYGYGLLDAGRLVDLAKRWNTTGPQRKCSIRIIYKPLPHDTSREGYRDWSFMSTHYWDENPWGVWSLLLENKGDAYNTGSLDSFVLKLYGTEEDMRARPVAASMVGSCAVRSADGECLECHGPFYVLQRRCVSYCPPRYYALSRPSLAPDGTPRNARFCAACHPSCYTCLGGAENNCTACPPFSSFQEANHRCLQHPYYTSRGGEVAREHGHLPLLLAVALMFVGPVVFSLLYGAYRLASRRDKGRKGAGARAESGSEPLCLNQTEECLKEPLRKPFP
ncbi:proprotein convertase subtilisin/kexin type 4-like isoform X2 [Podarcis raffonei]|uniref:proprotein convertase subtilisin/kexin type 4-like isoform X2 n=1 Tax=Podarcis raffonei TaxID=65483 RepID=UPI00232967EB|nr:proprotein convertase subtilisin/kexin type 4-like isoform X2 [Podarcis raffonei]